MQMHGYTNTERTKETRQHGTVQYQKSTDKEKEETREPSKQRQTKRMR